MRGSHRSKLKPCVRRAGLATCYLRSATAGRHRDGTSRKAARRTTRASTGFQQTAPRPAAPASNARARGPQLIRWREVGSRLIERAKPDFGSLLCHPRRPQRNGNRVDAAVNSICCPARRPFDVGYHRRINAVLCSAAIWHCHSDAPAKRASS